MKHNYFVSYAAAVIALQLVSLSGAAAVHAQYGEPGAPPPPPAGAMMSGMPQGQLPSSPAAASVGRLLHGLNAVEHDSSAQLTPEQTAKIGPIIVNLLTHPVLSDSDAAKAVKQLTAVLSIRQKIIVAAAVLAPGGFGGRGDGARQGQWGPGAGGYGQQRRGQRGPGGLGGPGQGNRAQAGVGGFGRQGRGNRAQAGIGGFGAGGQQQGAGGQGGFGLQRGRRPFAQGGQGGPLQGYGAPNGPGPDGGLQGGGPIGFAGPRPPFGGDNSGNGPGAGSDNGGGNTPPPPAGN